MSGTGEADTVWEVEGLSSGVAVGWAVWVSPRVVHKVDWGETSLEVVSLVLIPDRDLVPTALCRG